MLAYSMLSYKRYICAGLCLFSAFFLVLSLTTFSFQSPSLWYTCISDQTLPATHYLGVCGTTYAAIFIYFLGGAAWICIPLLGASGVVILKNEHYKRYKRIVVGCCFLVLGVTLLSAQMQADFYTACTPGGCVGYYSTRMLQYFFDPMVVYAFTIAINFVGLLLVVQFSWVRPLRYGLEKILELAHIQSMAYVVVQGCKAPFKKITSYIRRAPLKRDTSEDIECLLQEIIARDCKRAAQDTAIFEDPFWKQSHEPQHIPESSLLIEKSDDIAAGGDILEEFLEEFKAPPITLFAKNSDNADTLERDSIARERAKNLEAKLELFGIKGDVVSITTGPVVTLFEYAPASDVKISKIVMLEDDLALALEAHSLRIIAPIPGRAVIGFEVANTQRQMVLFSDIVSGATFKKHKGMLPLIIGRDTVGNDVVVDLAEMPHLLVAGSTGSGKSVALNAMLTSMLCRAHPDEVNLILIDPKRLEFAAFADIAHLVFPVVTDVTRVPLILRWAVQTMEQRYEQLAAAGVRHVSEYHKKHTVAAMPYLVIVIDELADLMMTVGKEVEELIARLAQMARAAGIHIIIATQRPSVDVITGLIKVNFPSRIACKVISKVDSRTILDCSGAEKLLGKGDMLFLTPKGAIARVHGAYVKDEEIISVVEYIKRQRAAVYQELAVKADAQDMYEEDPLYEEVVTFVSTMQQVSISLLQRRFRIGYNRSARLIDTLEARGVLMPADGGKFRKVLR